MSAAIPGIYRHFKGGRDIVLGEAAHAETGERLVIYVSLKSNAIFARPLGNFRSEVDNQALLPASDGNRRDHSGVNLHHKGDRDAGIFP